MISVFLLLILNGCAYLNSYQTESAQYENLIEKELKEDRLFVRGEQRLAIKVLSGSDKMFRLQTTVAPDFAFKHKPEFHQVIVAISSQNRIPFMKDELRFLLDEAQALSVEELTSNFQIQTLYPFAYPYYRVFVVDFIGTQQTERIFRLHSSRGPLSVKLQFFPVEQNRINSSP